MNSRAPVAQRRPKGASSGAGKDVTVTAKRVGGGPAFPAQRHRGARALAMGRVSPLTRGPHAPRKVVSPAAGPFPAPARPLRRCTWDDGQAKVTRLAPVLFTTARSAN